MSSVIGGILSDELKKKRQRKNIGGLREKCPKCGRLMSRLDGEGGRWWCSHCHKRFYRNIEDKH